MQSSPYLKGRWRWSQLKTPCKIGVSNSCGGHSTTSWTLKPHEPQTGSANGNVQLCSWFVKPQETTQTTIFVVRAILIVFLLSPAGSSSLHLCTPGVAFSNNLFIWNISTLSFLGFCIASFEEGTDSQCSEQSRDVTIIAEYTNSFLQSWMNLRPDFLPPWAEHFSRSH